MKDLECNLDKFIKIEGRIGYDLYEFIYDSEYNLNDYSEDICLFSRMDMFYSERFQNFYDYGCFSKQVMLFELFSLVVYSGDYLIEYIFSSVEGSFQGKQIFRNIGIFVDFELFVDVQEVVGVLMKVYKYFQYIIQSLNDEEIRNRLDIGFVSNY